MKSICIYVACCMLLVGLSVRSLGQDKAEKPISEEDKKAIIKLFEGVDKSKYRLQFNHGKEVYGTRKVSMKELEQVRKVRNPASDAGYVVLIVVDDGAVYILAVSKGSKLQTVLGKEKTKSLNAIMAKYAR